MKDLAADEGCRVWVTCPACLTYDVDGCYMLGYTGPEIFAQCPSCWFRWWHDSEFTLVSARMPEELWLTDVPDEVA